MTQTPREYPFHPLLSGHTIGNAVQTAGFVRDLPTAAPRLCLPENFFFTASSYCNALAADCAALSGALPSEIYA